LVPERESDHRCLRNEPSRDPSSQSVAGSNIKKQSACCGSGTPTVLSPQGFTHSWE